MHETAQQNAVGSKTATGGFSPDPHRVSATFVFQSPSPHSETKVTSSTDHTCCGQPYRCSEPICPQNQQGTQTCYIPENNLPGLGQPQVGRIVPIQQGHAQGSQSKPSLQDYLQIAQNRQKRKGFRVHFAPGVSVTLTSSKFYEAESMSVGKDGLSLLKGTKTVAHFASGTYAFVEAAEE